MPVVDLEKFESCVCLEKEMGFLKKAWNITQSLHVEFYVERASIDF